ncbi:MAG: hypothetical protein KJP15_03670 [Gammaproteobacteria bacterium]|nr:hypothetical protein [Gammaproteobacteria bacterium]
MIVDAEGHAIPIARANADGKSSNMKILDRIHRQSIAKSYHSVQQAMGKVSASIFCF